MWATKWPTENMIEIEEVLIDGNKMKIHKNRESNLRLVLEIAAKRHPKKAAFIFNNKEIVYEDLLKKIRMIGAGFANEGVEKGDRVAILMSNTLEFVLGYLAAIYIGAIAVPLNYRLSSEELHYQLLNVGAKILLLEKDYWQNFEQIKSDLPELKRIYLIEGDSVEDVTDFNALLEFKEESCPEIYISEEDIAAIIFTSGTTGRPKGVMLCHRNLITNSLNVCHILKTNTNMRQLLFTPLFHVSALHGQLIPAILLGATTILMSKFSTKESLKIMANERITCVVAVPTIYWFWLTHEDFPTYDLTSLTTASCGGAPASPELIKLMSQKLPNAEFINAGGMTECSSLAWALPAEYALKKLGSVGFAMPCVDVKIVDEKGEETGVNEAGELYYRGPNVAKGYWNNEKAWSETMIDGWLHSGDLGKVDEDGFLWLLDRKHDMIIRGGENIYCIEVENVIHQHPKIEDVAVVGVPDKIFGERVKAFLVVQENVDVTEEELQEFCSQKLADFKVPELFEKIKELPRNASGKVEKQKLRELSS